MSHEFESGFVVRQPAWHGLATVIDDYPGDWGQARKLAGLDWEPIEKPIFVGQPLTVDQVLEGTTQTPVELPGWKAVVRSDNDKVLHVHKDSYEIFPNAELGPLVEALLDEKDVQVETMGSLDEGRKVWVLVRLKEPFQVPGDPAGATLSYLAVQNSHDGSAALRAQRTQIRIVCANTSAAADRDAAQYGMEYSFRHTTNMRDRIEEARKMLAGLRTSQVEYLAWAQDLLGIEITDQQRELFVREFVPDPPTDSLISTRVRNNIDKAREDLRVILKSPTTRDTAHTAYGLVQASIEYLDHVRGARSQETRFNRTMLNTEPMKRQAERLAREVAVA